MQESDKRIVRNTVYLYFRMFLTMGISFFTTRIVLEKLGVSDYGVNNVVGGFVSMFTLFNSIMQTGTGRYIALSLGKGDHRDLRATVSTAVVIHLITAGVIFMLAESVGLWFVNNKLNIEPGRIEAMNVIYQCAVAGVCLSIIQNPFTAVVTAHERFGIYAYISIAESVMKLVVVYTLVSFNGDKLMIYGVLNLVVVMINLAIYRIYCMRQFEECRGRIRIDRALFGQMMRFSGWSALGNLSSVLNQQGVSILLNIFFNTAVNAARGLAGTVSFIISQMVNGIISASVPQLVKYHGAGEDEKFRKLIYNVSQYTIFLLSVIALPVMLEIDYALGLWLGQVPEHTALFIRITVINNLIIFSNMMVDQGIVAIGKMKQLALLTCPIYLLNFPLTYMVLELGYGPASVYWVAILPTLSGFGVNLWILKRYAGFDSRGYFINVFLKNMGLIAVSAVIPLLIRERMDEGAFRFVTVCATSVVMTVAILLGAGLNRENREMVTGKIVGGVRSFYKRPGSETMK